jgi:hypothetical protein
MTPGTLARPPTMITTRISIDRVTSKLFGKIDWIWEANSAPPKLARIAPMMNANSLAETMLMPMASATASSSRIAIQARPIREFCNEYEM